MHAVDWDYQRRAIVSAPWKQDIDLLRLTRRWAGTFFCLFPERTADMQYGEDYSRARAEIEDLMSRYIFALDWLDVETYMDTFADDAVLTGVFGHFEGREAIRSWTPTWFEYYPKKFGGTTGKPLSRHFITSLVLKVDGDFATGRAYWSNNDIQSTTYFGAFGHYEDEFRRVNGQWLISRREVFGERLDEQPTRKDNPAW